MLPDAKSIQVSGDMIASASVWAARAETLAANAATSWMTDFGSVEMRMG